MLATFNTETLSNNLNSGIALIPGNGDPPRTTLNVYDWRNQLVASKEGHQGGGSGESVTTNRPLTVYEYDNLGQNVASFVYDGDGVTPTYSIVSDSVTNPADSVPAILASYTDFDVRGQVYQTRAVDPNVDHDNNPSTPVIAFTVKASFWYDAQGRVYRQQAPGGLVTQTVYDCHRNPKVSR